MFFGNGRKKQLSRLLREFPWLWAVQSSWKPGFDNVRVRYAQESSILHTHPRDRRIWVKTRFGDDLERVCVTIQRAQQPLAEAVVGTIATGETIEYVVVADEQDADGRDTGFFIFRGPSRREGLHKFCCHWARMASLSRNLENSHHT